MIPWKVAWAGDSSYKTHRKSKAEQEEKLRAIQEEMNMKVASLESQMDAKVNESIALALSQRGTTGSHPDVVISPASQRRSSCASTAAPDVQAEQQPQIEPTAVDDQRYPVDDVTMLTLCKLHVSKKYIHSCRIRVSPAPESFYYNSWAGLTRMRHEWIYFLLT